VILNFKHPNQQVTNLTNSVVRKNMYIKKVVPIAWYNQFSEISDIAFIMQQESI
jgi:hypothetical protein